MQVTPCGRLFLGFLFCLLRFGSPSAFAEREGLPAPDLASLSGKWIGSTTTIRIGNCLPDTFGRTDSVAMQGQAVVTPVVLEVSAQSSGAVVIREFRETPPKLPPRILVGEITPGLEIRVDQHRASICDEDFNVWVTSYSGKVILKKRGAKIKLEATEDICPRLNCRLRIVVEAKKSMGTEDPGEPSD